jgi:hypothetical protein
LRYAYSGLPPGCENVNSSSLGCAPSTAGDYPLILTVSGANGATANVSTNLTVFPVGGGGGVQITSFSGGTGVVPLGQSTVLSVTATNGLGPLTYDYEELPPGCASQNLSSLMCTPTANGTFRLYVVVTDSAGTRSGAFGTLEVAGGVAPSPYISLFSAAPRTVRVGSSMLVFVSVDGGVAPLTYAYTDLPAGCAGVNDPELNCTPTAAGRFSVTVVVTDALQRSTNASLLLIVLPAEVPSGGSSPWVSFDLSELRSWDGALALAFVIGAAGLLVGTEVTLRRTRARAEGDDLVRAMALGPDDPGAPGGQDPPRVGPGR